MSRCRLPGPRLHQALGHAGADLAVPPPPPHPPAWVLDSVQSLHVLLALQALHHRLHNLLRLWEGRAAHMHVQLRRLVLQSREL